MGSAAGPPSPPGRGVDRRVGLYAALAALVLALAAVTWTAVGDDPPGGGAAPEASPSPGPTGGLAADAHRPTGESALVDNPLYGTGRLAPLPCPAPELDVRDPSSMEVFLHAVSDCLDDAWTTQFERAGIPFRPPERVFWSDPGRSPCRDYPSAAGAFYCRADTSVYIGTSDVVEKWNGAEDSAVYASLLAHEYAHHVQGESGLLEYYHEQRRLEADRTDQNAWTRRSELQANCLAGVFLGSVRVSYPLEDGDIDAVLADAAATADREGGPEDERTHGSADNSTRWMRHGLDRQEPGACNTWDVEDPSLVE
ncbi:neutral zinc metallopeptidase [Nocardiopsis trehalosi]|uniref:neutral zinc metallopeptidase n=1 Tax=Nocardiopsis trehalosi TaxID=109329 RepID=UPI00373FDC3D